METQLRDELTAFLKFGGMLWSVKDPHCGPILSDVAEGVAGDLAKYAARSKWAQKWLSKAVDVGELIPFALRLQPLLTAIYEHHISPAVAARTGLETEEPAHAGYGPLG
ncbi:hypothetical protein [Actinocrispum wychmicini]|uniref:hypothetical protein n=1 Tax=Actinocrispum wychmicini TaxID=1213861 RepID=UPI0010521127|nr:hypothetical protein [Actinocrispum wychmicini]